ncbi:MAG: hypothetical protein OXU75_19645 [Deltaproteobacteria bacterium]|nr:hypothetical protein [Deltaproteobacteria bacterium]
MGLKEFIDNHPAVYTVSFIVAAIGATTAVVGNLNDRHTKALQHQHAAQLTDLRSSLNTQINDLATRLNSIERRFGDEAAFFDVTKLSIAPGQFKTLSTDYRPYQNGKFFVHVPPSDKWSHQQTTEGAYYREVLKEHLPVAGPMQSLMSQLDKAPVDIWRHSETLALSISLGDDTQEVRLFPHILIQTMSRKQLEGLLQPILRDDVLTKIFDDLSEKVRGYAEDRTRDPTSSKWVEELAGIMFDDVTGFILMSRLQQHYMMATLLKKVRFRVLSIQKKGNVVYWRSQRIFYDDTDQTLEKLLVDEEVFLVGTGSELVLVSVQVPSKHGQHDAFNWAAAWLAGLRIAIGT